jgi:hypothetical protein
LLRDDASAPWRRLRATLRLGRRLLGFMMRSRRFGAMLETSMPPFGRLGLGLRRLASAMRRTRRLPGSGRRRGYCSRFSTAEEVDRAALEVRIAWARYEATAQELRRMGALPEFAASGLTNSDALVAAARAADLTGLLELPWGSPESFASMWKG